MSRSENPRSAHRFLFDARVSLYDAWFRKPPGSLQFPGEVSALRLLVEDLPRPWLEVGVGTGRLTQALGFDLGLDPGRKMLLRARKRRLQIVQGTGGQLPFRDGVFGCVLLMTTLCFVADPELLLQEARRVIKQDGGLVVADILKESPWGQHYRELGKKGHRLYRYARFYSLRELEGLLGAGGFTVIERTCSVVQPPTRVAQEERGWWGISPTASFAALLGRKAQ